MHTVGAGGGWPRDKKSVTCVSMTPSVKLNVFQRAINKVGRPFGILPFPFVWQPNAPAGGERQNVFEQIFEANTWNSGESVSGPGSEIYQTTRYRAALVSYLRRHRVKSLFDAPCGDLNWMSEVLGEVPLHYIGGELSEAVLSRARSRRPDLDLRHFDICVDEFPEVEVWHCRDTLLHLSFADIRAALRNAARSKINFALITTHRSRILRNLDAATGGARPLDLELPPFCLPKPIEYLKDDSGWGFPRAVGVWPIESIRELVARTPVRLGD